MVVAAGAAGRRVADRITSPSNPRIKSLARLAKRSERDATGLFLIEGERAVLRAIEAGVTIEQLVVCRELMRGPGAVQPSLPAPTIDVGRDAFAKLAYRAHPDGMLAVARQPDVAIESLALGDAPLVLIAEALEKPGNLGAILRAADAAGAAVVAADPATDLFNPNVVRASQGALFTVPVAVASPPSVITWAAGSDIDLYAASPDATTRLWDVDLTGATGIVVGSEHRGLSPAWDGVATPVSIPMAGDGDSLNAATAAALLLYEAVRQRVIA